jgi:hypothetical protein
MSSTAIPRQRRTNGRLPGRPPLRNRDDYPSERHSRLIEELRAELLKELMVRPRTRRHAIELIDDLICVRWALSERRRMRTETRKPR